MNLRTISLIATALFACATAVVSHAADDQQSRIKSVVDRAVEPVMAHYGIPGMAVGIIDGDRHYVFNYGLASTENRKPVTGDTLFELGSISKTFTATLTSYAQASGYLSLSDQTGKYLPSLRDTRFGKVSLLNLGTHTPGGLPLQVPDSIHNNAQLMQYFRQ
ncbi:MAG: beta-lactamase class, partial [Paraburkholderia sp.]|uniref:serine hydrolase n=1 Tax=Paraburkholderia sp. TaxID=1926495 RepID=UPI002AFE92C1